MQSAARPLIITFLFFRRHAAFPCSMIHSDCSKNNVITIRSIRLNVTFAAVQTDPRRFSHLLLLTRIDPVIFLYRSSASYGSSIDISSSIRVLAIYLSAKYNSLFNFRKMASIMIALQTSCSTINQKIGFCSLTYKIFLLIKSI